MAKIRRQKRRPNRPQIPTRKIKKERHLSPTRWSRRVRKLPPISVQSLHTFHKKAPMVIKKENLATKSTMTVANRKLHLKKSSSEFNIKYQRGSRLRTLKYPPQDTKNSKEVVSIFSAPKVIKKKTKKSFNTSPEIEVTIRGSSCKSKMVLRKHTVPPKEIYTVSKTPRCKSVVPNGASLEKRKNFVLEVLNKGDIKEISRLHSVGSKTAERILLYRQLKGSFVKISELASMPDFNEYNYQKFIQRNFLPEEV